MSFCIRFAEPFFAGTSVSSDERWDVSLGGRGYMIDWERGELFGRASIDMIRQQADTSDRPGENSLNPEGPWRRAQESWHHGAGQEWLDRPDSDPFRFHASRGVDVWDRYGLSLLPAVASSRASTATNQLLAVARGALFAADGTGIRYHHTGFWNGPILGTGAVTSLTSDGAWAYYTRSGEAGIFRTSPINDFVQSQYVTTVLFALVGWAKGRLLGFYLGGVYNPVAGGTAPAALWTHPLGADWIWDAVGEGPNHILMAGHVGDKSVIYKTGVKPDGTALDIPTVAASLPEGEIARSLSGYLDYVVVGTDRGVRFAAPDGNGNLTLGALIPTPNPVLCAEGQDRFVWFGWTNYDTAYTGLGRMDLTTFTAPLTPAYASDLMAAAQGTVQGVVTYLNKRWFSVAGQGVYVETTGTAAAGRLISGRVTFDLPDTKTALDMDVRHDPLTSPAYVTVSLSADSNTPVVVGTSKVANSTSPPDEAFTLNQLRGSTFEWTVDMTNAVLRRVTLRADPHSERTTRFSVPLLLRESIEGDAAVEMPVDVDTERVYLIDLCETGAIVAYQEGAESFRVKVQDYRWHPTNLRTKNRTGYQGTLVAILKGV